MRISFFLVGFCLVMAVSKNYRPLSKENFRSLGLGVRIIIDMSEMFFENPLKIYIALGLIELVCVIVFLVRRTGKSALALLVPLGLAGIVALVAYLVVTDREQITAAVHDIANAIVTAQPERIPPYLDEQFTAHLFGESVRKNEIKAVCNSSIKKWGISEIKFHNMRIEVENRDAKFHVNTFITFSEHGGGRHPLIWDATWVKRGKKWLVLNVREPRTGFEL
ncbi:MAG: hypothetical protein ACYSTL_01585 [Planctomycetota bacterium]|jgi:uncharacterized membrane protein (GlpM family)